MCVCVGGGGGRLFEAGCSKSTLGGGVGALFEVGRYGINTVITEDAVLDCVAIVFIHKHCIIIKISNPSIENEQGYTQRK